MAQQGGCLYTIGHSNHNMETFLSILGHFQVQVLVDVRSQPYSRYVPHFGKEPLRQALESAGLKYLFLGKELGGRPAGEDFYDREGRVMYEKLAGSSSFQEGIARLEKGMTDYQVALMCSEEDPAKCHRYWLLGRVLQKRGVEVRHIRGDGTRQGQKELADRQEKSEAKENYRQMRLF